MVAYWHGYQNKIVEIIATMKQDCSRKIKCMKSGDLSLSVLRKVNCQSSLLKQEDNSTKSFDFFFKIHLLKVFSNHEHLETPQWILTIKS